MSPTTTSTDRNASPVRRAEANLPLRVHYGCLESADWLAVLLGHSTGTGRARAMRILARRDLIELARFGVAQWVEEFGLGIATAERLVAAFALGRRLESARRPPGRYMRSAQRVFEEVAPRLRGGEQEEFLAVLLDAKHALKRTVRVTAGTLTTSLVHPREVFRPAIREAAAAVIVAHNHPSGDPEPSHEDLDVTRRLIEAGRLLGIPVLDHLVVGDGRFVSLRDRMDF